MIDWFNINIYLFIFDVDLYEYVWTPMGLSLNNGHKPLSTAGVPPLWSGNLQTNSVENPLKSKL